MCILFVAINANAPADRYKLILASNRDEFYNRPALPAHHWEKEPHMLGGMDVEPGREGGTWLAMNSLNGKIGILLNITSNDNSPERQGRGRLVPDFLSQPADGIAYSNNVVHQDKDRYNPFNLVTVDSVETNPIVTYYSNRSGEKAITLGPSGRFGFGNSVYSTPYKKVECGTQDFESLVRDASTRNTEKSKLIEGLLQFLKGSQRHYPDPQLQLQAGHFAEEFVKGLSSRYVHIPRAKYGTRTHTVVLVGGDNHVDFHEWTMEEPIVNSNKPNWKHTTYSFSLNTPANL